jgi:3-dehydroquinate dehydratase-1
MRQQSKIQVTVRNTVIGGPRLLVCLPLVAPDLDSLLGQARELVPLQPDLVEWRIDAFAKVAEIKECQEALHHLRQVIGEIPLILTCRIDREGGFKAIPEEKRLELITRLMASGDVDLVDVELCNGSEFLAAVRTAAVAGGCRLILSHHNFQETPDEAFLMTKLLEGQTAGADIVKLAVMPKNYGDVLTLLSATNKARNGAVTIPIVTVAMGVEGVITRLAGGLFGSDITFAIGSKASAPGQVPIGDLRAGMALLYGA